MTPWYPSVGVSPGAVSGVVEAQPDRLVEGLLRGDELALKEVYRHHHEAVRAFARRLTGEDDQAEELVQEVFVAVPRAMQRFRAESSLRTFLIGVAVNHAKHFVRSASRRRAALARLALEPQAPVALPDEALAQGQLAALLTRAMDRLPLEQRVAFVLSEVEEHGAREAAALAGVPESTFRARVRVAKQKLRALLGEAGLE